MVYDGQNAVARAPFHSITSSARPSSVAGTSATVYEKNGAKVIAFEVDHGDLIKPAYGYRIEYGGRVALLRAAEALKRIRTQNDDQKTGVEIVRKALSWPARQIAVNAGEDGSVIVGKILEKDQYNFGFDAQNGEYGNLVTKGIIDPTKVVRSALQNAASIAGLLITTEAMVTERPKKDGGAPAMPGGGMGGMGGMDY
jgi:chaperonin GroEL (HSP60 family)